MPITFSQPFAGNQVIYAAARSNTLTSGWQSIGTVSVPALSGGITMSFSPPSLRLTGAETQNLTLTLSGPAPAGGLTLNLSSNDTGVATVAPASITIPANTTTATIQVTGVTAGSAMIRAADANLSAASPADATATVTVQPLTLSISSTSLPNGTAGTPYSTTVTATGGTQPYHWSATGLPNNLAINSTTGDIIGTPAGTGSSSVHITVTDSSASVQTAVGTFTLTVNAQVPASIAVAGGSPQSAMVTTAFANTLKALVKDAGNNPVAGATVTFTAPGSGASGVFAGGVTTAVTDGTGVATSAVFTANGTVGSYAVTASIGALSTNFTLTNTVGNPASIAVTGGSPQSAVVNTAFANTLKVLVKDAGNNPVSGATVTFGAPGSGASGTFAGGVATAVTDGTGVATSAVFTANATAGSYAVTASIGALSTSFTLTNTAGAPASIAVAGGSPQSAGINTAFANRLKALVKDANNNPVSGVTVTFTAPGSGATLAFTGGQNTAVTDGTGVATSAAMTAGSVLGTYNVVASANPGLSVNFSLTNQAGPPALMSIVSGAGQSAATNTAFVSTLQVRVMDTDHNPVSGVTVTFTPPVSGAGGAFAGGKCSGNG